MKRRYVIWLFFILVGLSCSSDKLSEEELFKKANTFENNESYQEAIQGYEKVVREYPQGKMADEALEREAFLYYNNIHDFHKAIALHKQLIEQYPDGKSVARARFMIGFIYANDLKDLDLAKAAYEEFLSHHSDDELAESVKWELEHLGQDINEQLLNAFEPDKTDGATRTN